MKKIWIGVVVVLILIAAPFVVQRIYSGWGQSYYGQVNSTLGRKPTKDSDGNVFGHHYEYRIKAYNKDGKEKTLMVNSMDDKPFTKGHYIKVLWTAGKGVKSYEGVKWSEVPKKAQEHLRR